VRKTGFWIVLGTFVFSLAAMAQTRREWVEVTPGTEKMEKISIYAEPEVPGRIVLHIKLPGILTYGEKVEQMTYKRLTISGAGFMTEVGKPELPVLRRLVKIPLAATATVERATGESILVTDYNVFPAQEPWAEHVKAEKPKFQKDAALYAANAFYPREIAKLGRPAIIRGIQVVPIEVFPLQYNPVSKQLRIYRDIRVNLRYSEGAPQEERDRSEAAYSELFAPLLQKSIINYRPPSDLEINNWRRFPWPWHVDYLIITHDNFYNSIKPLADAKKAEGLYVKIVKTSTINPSGPSAGEILKYIQNIYFKSFPHLSYVLIVGDAEYVPTFYKHAHPSIFENNKEIGTDLYYSTMDGSNDYLPDIAVGRLPGDTADDIAVMVEKILRYEESRKIKACFFNNVLHCAYFQDRDHDGIEDRWFLQTSEEVHQYFTSIHLKCTTVYVATPSSPASKFYNDGLTPVPPQVLFDGSTQAIINGIDHGVFLVIHRDHGDSANGPIGSSDGWGDPQFVTSDVALLANSKEYPVVFSINCRSGWFDGETDKDGGTVKVDCFGEALLKKKDGGASGFIGSTRISYSGYNDDLAKGLVDALWPDFDPGYSEAGADHLGDILNYAKIYMAEIYGYPDPQTNLTVLTEFEEFHVLGDPEMGIKPTKFMFSPHFPYYKVLRYIDIR